MKFTFGSSRISNAKGRLAGIKSRSSPEITKEILINDYKNGFTKFKTKNGYEVSIDLGANEYPEKIKVSSKKGQFTSNLNVQEFTRNDGTIVTANSNGDLEVTKPSGDGFILTGKGTAYYYNKSKDKLINIEPETFFEKAEKELDLFDLAKLLSKREIKNSILSDGIKGDSDLMDLFSKTLKHGGKLNYLNYIK